MDSSQVSQVDPIQLIGMGLLGVFILVMLNPKHVMETFVALVIVATPMMYNVYMPRSALGVRGLSADVILFVMASMLVAARVVGSGRLFGLIRIYLSVPLLIMISVYVMGFGLTFLADGDHPFYRSGATRSDLLLLETVRPLMLLLMGWFAMVVCFVQGSKVFIQRALLLGPVVLLPVVVYFAALGGGTDLNAGRATLSWYLRLHANQVGAIGVYFLVLSLTMKDHSWPVVRAVAVVCSLALIAFSLSRIAFLTTLVMLGLLYFKIGRAERRVLTIGLVVSVLLFAGDWAYRLQSGLDLKDSDDIVQVSSLDGEIVDLNAVSAGRVDDIWRPALNMIEKKPWLGYGIGTQVETSKFGFIPVHNGYLTVLLQLGIVGILVLANFLFFAFRDSHRRKDELYYLLIALCCLTLTGHQFYPYHSNHILWVVYGMVVAERYSFARGPLHSARPAKLPGRKPVSA